ncbi:MAG TPA: hypothetical protein VGC49_11545 [Solirubrobacterales bacterium]
MEVAAVGLEDEALLSPEKVDRDAFLDQLHGRVGARRGQAAAREQRQHHRLQWALEVGRRGEARSPRRCPLERAPHGAGARGRGEIDKGPRRARAWNAVDGAHLGSARRRNRVCTDAIDLPAAFPRGNHVDHHRGTIYKSEQGSGAAMRNHRALAAGERRRHHPRPLPRNGEAHRVDTAEDAVQKPGANGVRDRLVAHPEVTQLPPRHEPVLTARERGERRPDLGTPSRIAVPFGPYGGQKERRSQSRPPGPGALWKDAES